MCTMCYDSLQPEGIEIIAIECGCFIGQMVKHDFRTTIIFLGLLQELNRLAGNPMEIFKHELEKQNINSN